MDEAFYNKFYLALMIAGAIVLIAAVLLILIWVAAKKILRLANTALQVVVNIKTNTLSIWELQHTNEKASDILNEAETIEEAATAVAQALHETQKQS